MRRSRQSDVVRRALLTRASYPDPIAQLRTIVCRAWVSTLGSTVLPRGAPVTRSSRADTHPSRYPCARPNFRHVGPLRKSADSETFVNGSLSNHADGDCRQLEART